MIYPETVRFADRSAGMLTASCLALALLSVACAPRQTGVDQVPDGNVALTALKDAGVPGLPANVDQILDDYLAQPGKAPGCAIGVMKDHQIEGLEAYGLADLASARPMTTSTPSVLGSASKTLTALGIWRLKEMHLLNIDAPISNFLPDLPPSWQSFTARQLMAHQSGLARDPVMNPALDSTAELNQFYGLNPADPFLGIHPRLVYPAYLGTPIAAFPGNQTASYSNTGYLLLGALIDKIVTDNAATIGAAYASYESFVWREVGLFDGNLSNGNQLITPSLYTRWRSQDIPELAKGYRWNNSQFVELNASNDPVLLGAPAGFEGPAGSWAMTIGDLTRLMLALENNDIISGTDHALMTTAHATLAEGDVGYGAFVGHALSFPFYYHSGEHSGYRAGYYVWPTQNVGVAVLCNSNSADVDFLGEEVASEFIVDGLGGLNSAPPPGVGATPGNGSEPQIDPVVAQRLLVGFAAQQAAQLQAETADHDRLAELEARGCVDLAADTLEAGGYSIGSPFFDCFDDANTTGGGLEACVLARTDELIGRGLLSRGERTQIESCLEVFTGSP